MTVQDVEDKGNSSSRGNPRAGLSTPSMADRLRENSALMEIALSVTTNRVADEPGRARVDVCRDAADVIDELLQAARLGLFGLEVEGRGKSDTANAIRAAILKATSQAEQSA